MIKLLVITFLINFTISCAPQLRPGTPSTVSITLPKSDLSKRSSLSTKRGIKAVNATSLFAGPDLQIIDDVDCYTVAISNIGVGNCKGNISHELGIQFISPTVNDGGQIVLEEIPTLIPLKFLVFGFSKGSLELCPDLRFLDQAAMAQMSRPTIVGTRSLSLEPIEENIVSIDVTTRNANFIDSCGGTPFNWQAGGVFGTAIFGQSKFAP